MSLELFHAVERYVKQRYFAEVIALDKNTLPQGFVVAYAKDKLGKTTGYNVKLSDLTETPASL